MTIDEAIRAVSEEYDADMARAGASQAFAAAMKAALGAEYDEIDQELPGYVAKICQAAGAPQGRLPVYVYVAARMAFRMGMRVQRKLARPDQATSALWRGEEGEREPTEG